MKIESNYYTHYQKQINKDNINNKSCFSTLKNDSVSFTGKVNKPSNNFLSIVKDIILFPARKIKESKEKRKLAAKLEQEARRAAYKAEEEARFLIVRKNASEGSTEVMNDWLSRNKGLFENQKNIDNTSDVILLHSKTYNYDKDRLAPLPKRGEYSLTNLYGSGYRSGCGEGDFFCKSPSGKMISLLKYPIDMRASEIYTASDWGMQKTYMRSFGDDKLHLCTALRHSYQTSWGRAHARQPGFNIFIEGDLSQKEMNEIKKNLVEKGLIEKYEKDEDKESLIGIYQEIIKYLNK